MMMRVPLSWSKLAHVAGEENGSQCRLSVADKSRNWLYNRAMRIGIDCRLPTYRMGGISQYILQLISALADLDGENEYILLQSRKESRDFVPQTTANWKRANLWTPCHHRWERWSLSVELAPFGLDVLHSPDFIPPQRGARKHVVTIHDLNFIYFPDLLTGESKRYYADQIGWAVERADLISADSEATRDDIINKLGVAEHKVKTVHLAANPLFQERAAEADIQRVLAHFALPKRFLMAVGTLEPRKNLPMLLRIYGRLREERGIRVPLVLVGRKGWKYEEIFQTIDSLALAPFVVHLDRVMDEELHCLYTAAGVLATPSLYEGFGLPALEAQLSACPAVVSDRGSLPEIVGAQGLVLPLEDEDRWVETIARLLGDDDLRGTVVTEGLRQASKFSWQETARQTLDLYRSVTASS